jgi:hypothetical protein
MRVEDERDIKILIRRITEQVIRRLLEPEKAEIGALVLAPSVVLDAAPLKEYLIAKYGSEATCAGEGAATFGNAFATVDTATQPERQRFMESLKSYADVVLVSPPLWMLKKIAEGDDSGFFEQAFLRALLWNKNVSVMLDFEKPSFGRGTF